MKRPERGVELSCKGLNAWSLLDLCRTLMVRCGMCVYQGMKVASVSTTHSAP